MATVYALWDRKRKAFVGNDGPTIFATSPIATTAINRYAKNDPEKGDRKTIDVVSLTV